MQHTTLYYVSALITFSRNRKKRRKTKNIKRAKPKSINKSININYFILDSRNIYIKYYFAKWLNVFCFIICCCWLIHFPLAFHSNGNELRIMRFRAFTYKTFICFSLKPKGFSHCSNSTGVYWCRELSWNLSEIIIVLHTEKGL